MTSISSHAKPLCATQTASDVGSVTIAASAPTCSATAWVPMLANSSSQTATTMTSPASSSSAARAHAQSAAAVPPFMSYEPRP